jgi:hypothetical protein
MAALFCFGLPDAASSGRSRVAGPGLALRAEVGAAPCDDNSPDQVAAPATGLSGPLVNAQPGCEIPRPSLDVNIVSKACALKVDGALEDFFYGAMQAAGLVW